MDRTETSTFGLAETDRAVNGSVAIDNSAADGESPTNEKALMIENMELVEPRKTMHIPNHLLETKTFAKVGQNAFIHTKPSVIHFEGFEVGEKQTRKLVLLNASSDILRMHIIPPQSRHFYIRYTKPARMVAGMTLECLVEFTPDEWRYYYDCIRIHCPGEENIVVPIHGYPIMSTKEFPRNYTFQSIPVGHRLSKAFPLKCMAPIDFEFSFKYIQPHPAFLIEPLSGIVPANGQVEITVIFAPFEFQTASMKVELTISQFNSRGIVCTFTGSSRPGLLKTKTMSSVQSEVLDPRCFSPLDRSRTNKNIKRSLKTKTSSAPPQMMALEKNGVRFPAVIDTPYHVGKVLMQEPGKVKVNEMRQNLLAKKASNDSSRQMKEAVFESAVRQAVYEERQNQLRWQVRLGEDPLSGQARYNILEDRAAALNHYRLKVRGDPVPEDEYERLRSMCTYKRTLREYNLLASSDAQFDTYTNDMWAVRHAALNKFVQAARTIIVRLRAIWKLNSLRKDMVEWSRQKYEERSSVNTRQKMESLDVKEGFEETPNFRANKIQKFKFPTYVPPNVKDDMAPDALGNVPFKPTEIVVKRDVPFFNLKVPHQYKLQGYQPHSVHLASSGYVPTHRVRQLRTGAEDEVINLQADQTPLCVNIDAATLEKDENMSAARATMAFTPRPPTATTIVDEVSAAPRDVGLRHEAVALTPPDALFKSVEYPSLHIMNPAPGLQVFQAPMPYAEVDVDYHLCPLPRYPRSDHRADASSGTSHHAGTQRRFLDREDTIRGIMSWRKFPSQGLTSLSNTPTLTNVWVPRWDNCFSTDLLPMDGPPLFDQLDPEDAENCVEEELEGRDEGGQVCLKPEMVNVQFTLIDPSSPSQDPKQPGDLFPYGNRMPSTSIPVGAHGPVPRERREEELDYFLTKKYNRLGSKVTSTMTALNTMLTDTELALK
ncbi:cilia- and flagella-associated protein 221-like [Plakobranchus ocellatus]|uniref:Cilia- and flagella-associated protein 221-like n=1 Tax=Plakobranchus ocellatus TaxID=259542 RepID=A0AAV4D9G5_9GAST|nr:cilia- and flagella-associated protein 221-like [Plakobranchus ocellatus]